MTKGTLHCIAIAITSTMLAAGTLRAQDFLAPTQTKGTKDTEVWTGLVVAQHDGSVAFNNEFWMAGARFGRVLTAAHGSGWLRGTLQWNFDVVPLFVVFNLQSAYGAEINPIVGRWNFTHKGRVAPYFEVAGGLAFTNTRIPPGDTSKINFVGSVGYGWQIFRRQQRAIDVGVHAWHLSNAWTAPSNPSANGIQVTVGYHWYGLRTQRAASSADESEPTSEPKQ
jgi:hypothetical protein